MGLPELIEALPEHARDIRLNLESVISRSSMPEQRLWGAVLGAAVASRHSWTRVQLEDEAAERLSKEAFVAAKAAAAVMAMSNVFFHAVHLLAEGGASEYETMPARLRMHVVGTHGGVEATDFELWCVCVSAVNGCGACLGAHEKTLRQHGVGAEEVLEAVRIAAVVHAVAVTLEAEETLSGGGMR